MIRTLWRGGGTAEGEDGSLASLKMRDKCSKVEAVMTLKVWNEQNFCLWSMAKGWDGANSLLKIDRWRLVIELQICAKRGFSANIYMVNILLLPNGISKRRY